MPLCVYRMQTNQKMRATMAHTYTGKTKTIHTFSCTLSRLIEFFNLNECESSTWCNKTITWKFVMYTQTHFVLPIIKCAPCSCRYVCVCLCIDWKWTVDEKFSSIYYSIIRWNSLDSLWVDWFFLQQSTSIFFFFFFFEAKVSIQWVNVQFCYCYLQETNDFRWHFDVSIFRFPMNSLHVYNVHWNAWIESSNGMRVCSE